MSQLHALRLPPLLPLINDRLEEFAHGIMPKLGLVESDIEDIYRCSPVQQGILLSQAKDAYYYQASIVWAANPAKDGPLVDRRAALLTVFMGVSGQGCLDQVILRHVEAEFERDTGSSILESMSRKPDPGIARSAQDIHACGGVSVDDQPCSDGRNVCCYPTA